MKTIKKLIVLALFFQIVTNLSAQNNNSTKKYSKMKTYIVLHTSGNVRNAETVLIAEVSARSPEKAIKKILNNPEAKYSKSYILHKDSKTADYARMENPSSFVSDIIDNYSAQKGSILRNNKNEMYFRVEFISQKNPFRKKVLQSKKIWGLDAKTILKKQLTGKYSKWIIDFSNKYEARARKPHSFSVRCVRVSIMYKLTK